MVAGADGGGVLRGGVGGGVGDVLDHAGGLVSAGLVMKAKRLRLWLMGVWPWRLVAAAVLGVAAARAWGMTR